jgi:hypothetical protein
MLTVAESSNLDSNQFTDRSQSSFDNSAPGSNPTILSYNASVEKFTQVQQVTLENKIIFYYY